MSSIRIEGDPPHELDRRSYDLRRPEVVRGAVCHAPWVSVHLRADGTVAPCRYTRATVGDLEKHDLEVIFDGRKAEKLRGRFQDYRLDAGDCAACVACMEEGTRIASHAEREFDRLRAAAPDAVSPLQISMPVSLALPKPQRKTVRAWLKNAQVLELHFEARSKEHAHVEAEALKDHLKALQKISEQRRPRLRLRCEGTIPRIPAARAGLVQHVYLSQPLDGRISKTAEGKIRRLVDALQPGGGEVTLRLTVDRDNWFELWPVLRQAAEWGVHVIPEPARPDDERSIAALDGDAIAALHGTLCRWKEEHAAISGSQAERRWDRLLTRMRRWQSRATKHEGRASAFGLPGLDHATMQDEAEARALLAGFLRVYRRTEVQTWLDALTGHPDFVAEARERLSLRVAALWNASVFQQRAMLPLLAEILTDRDQATARCEADLDALAGTELESWVRNWMEEHRLLGLSRRRRPFRIPAWTPGRASAQPAVTVLIPAYNHAAFVGRAIEGVLAQSHGDLRLLVVDDGSTDATCQIARGFVDPRVTVRENAANLGLGQSVAGALEHIDTEWTAILNSDDIFHPERLERCLEAAAAHPKAQVISTSLVPINQDELRCSADDSSPVFEGLRVFRWLQWYGAHKPNRVKPDELFGDLLESNFLVTSSNLFVRTAFLRAHVEEWRDLEFCLDWQLFLHAALTGELVYLAGPTLGYRLHDANTVWFDADREWRYYVELNQVAARVLTRLMEIRAPGEKPAQGKPDGVARIARLVDSFVRHMTQNSDLDGRGVLLGTFLLRFGLGARDLRRKGLPEQLQALRALNEEQRKALDVYRTFGKDIAELYRLRGEGPFLEATRVSHEALADELGRLQGEFLGALENESNVTRLWHQAEQERDQEAGAKAPLYEEIGKLQGEVERARFEQSEAERKEAREQEQLARLQAAHQELEGAHRDLETQLEMTRDTLQETLGTLDEVQGNLGRLTADHHQARDEADRLQDQLRQRTAERDQLQRSPEYRLGDLLLTRLGLRSPLRLAEKSLRHLGHRAVVQRMVADGVTWPWKRKADYKAMVTICWNFPIYSQTFVYQELIQLIERGGFDLRIAYSKLEPRSHLPAQFDALWSKKRYQVLDQAISRADFQAYQTRMPERVEEILTTLSRESGVDREAILDHGNFLQAFSYARMAEAYRPDYLHSYFFYDRTLFSWIASVLLDLPRGVSCYADHVMDDYEFKVVPLHLRTCDVVVATSKRIKRELLEIAPETDPNKIIVKPNAVDVRRFPVMEREEPAEDRPFRVVTTSRIEPKKGLITLARAAKRLRDRGVRVEFHLLGEADYGIQASLDYKERLLAEIERLDLWGVVHLEGRQDFAGITGFLQMSSLFIAPFVETATGDKDGIPTALLEGMATGLPAVCSDAGSMTEVVTPGTDGVIVPQRDAAALADAIEELLGDPARRAAMGAAAALKIRKEFDVSVCERRFHDRVLDILARRRAARDRA